MKKLLVFLSICTILSSFSSAVSAETQQELLQRIEKLTAIIKQDQQNRDAYFQRGQAYFALKKLQQAASNYLRVIELDPEYVPAYRDLALVSVSLGDTKNAFQLLDKASELDPKDGLNYFHRGMLHRKVGQHTEATLDLARAGENFRKAEHYKDALHAYSVLLKLAPKQAEAYVARGKTYNRMKNYSAALQDFGTAIRLDPSQASAYYNRGESFYRSERYAEALDDYTRVTELKPEDEGAHFNRGLTHVKLGRTAEAAADFSAVLKLSPQHHWAYYNRAKQHEGLGHKEEAARDYNAYLKLRAEQDKDAESIRQKIRDLGFNPEF